jgi:hypothetical protein
MEPSVMANLVRDVSIAFGFVWGGLAVAAISGFVFLWLLGVIVV